MKNTPKSLLFFVLSCAVVAAHAKPRQGIVTYVADGDTVWIEVDRIAKPIKLRLQGLDAPEICQAWGRQSRDALKTKLLGQLVSLESSARDDYARTIGRIQWRGEDMGAWLVKNGHAWSYAYQRRPAPYAQEMATAQNARLGLWASAGAQEPRLFRKATGSCKQGQ